MKNNKLRKFRCLTSTVDTVLVVADSAIIRIKYIDSADKLRFYLTPNHLPSLSMFRSTRNTRMRHGIILFWVLMTTMIKTQRAPEFCVLSPRMYAYWSIFRTGLTRHCGRPKVLSTKDLPPKKSQPDFRMFDAVLTTDKPPSTPMDPEMEKFLPMLNDYLKCTLS